jgi:phospholipid/cholesterol/gamma-HCH transport system substrate-binding protein
MNLYQFSRPQASWARAKVWADYHFLRYFYVTAGGDDVFNTWRSGRYPGGPGFVVGRDIFFGGGLTFTDDDLKTLFLGAGSAVGSAATSAK